MRNKRSQAGAFFSFSVIPFVVISLFTSPGAQTASFRMTTNAARWVDSGVRAGTAWVAPANYFTVDTNTRYQTFQGFGGCFCEMGWSFIQTLTTQAAKDSVNRALFDTSGCNLCVMRMPVGANDFGLSWYSYDETSGDNSMTNFSIAHDSNNVIPWIRAAQKYQKNMRFWASPWSPPTWMKNNNNYYDATNGSNPSTNSMKTDATTFTAYALYLSKYVQAYKAAGINIELITCQNEPDQIAHNYPTCGWAIADEVTFYHTYMIPRFNTDNLTTRILLGVYCCHSWAQGIAPFMSDATVKPFVGATSHSYESTGIGAQTWTTYPTIPFYQTEADWGNGGAHDWNQGVTQFNHIHDFIQGDRAAVYDEWGLVLDQNYATHWGFAQSGPININTSTHVIDYQPHFWALKHYAHYIQVGAKAINITVTGASPGNNTAFLNPNGDVVFVCSNTSAAAFPATVRVGNTMYKATFPATSFNTLLIKNTPTAVRGMQWQKNAMPVLSNVMIRNSTLYFSLSGAVNIREADLTLTDLQGRTVWTGRRAGSALQGDQQAFTIRPVHGSLHSGTYLLAARIKNGAGAVTTVEKKAAAVN